MNDVSASTPSTKQGAKSLVWVFFRVGEEEQEIICQLCPNHKVLRRKRGGSTSNLLRHVRSFHAKRFIEEKSKQPVMQKQNDQSEDIFDAEDDQERILKLLSEPLV